MKYIVGTFHVFCVVVVCGLLLQAYEYSFGSGYGLHPGVVGAFIGVIVLAMMWLDNAYQNYLDAVAE